MEAAIAIALIELILKYGPSAAIALIQGLKTTNPTPEMIRALKIKPPSSYFEEAP